MLMFFYLFLYFFFFFFCFFFFFSFVFYFFLFFFFFQAEDGIRDGTVTGVQTCALPICSDHANMLDDGNAYDLFPRPDRFSKSPGSDPNASAICPCTVTLADTSPRSEEHTSELQSQFHLVCRLLLEKKNRTPITVKSRMT